MPKINRLYIVDNGGEYEDHQIYFIESNFAERAVKKLLNSWFFDDGFKPVVIGTAEHHKFINKHVVMALHERLTMWKFIDNAIEQNEKLIWHILPEMRGIITQTPRYVMEYLVKHWRAKARAWIDMNSNNKNFKARMPDIEKVFDEVLELAKK